MTSFKMTVCIKVWNKFFKILLFCIPMQLIHFDCVNSFLNSIKEILWQTEATYRCPLTLLSSLQYKNIIVSKNQSIPYFPPHCGIQCSIPSKVYPLRKRLPLTCHENSSQIFDATNLWKHTVPLTYNTKTLISNISETHRFSPQMRLIAYPDHKTTLREKNMYASSSSSKNSNVWYVSYFSFYQ